MVLPEVFMDLVLLLVVFPQIQGFQKLNDQWGQLCERCKSVKKIWGELAIFLICSMNKCFMLLPIELLVPESAHLFYLFLEHFLVVQWSVTIHTFVTNFN